MFKYPITASSAAGTLRLTAVDVSVLASATTPRAPIDSMENVEAQNTIGNTTNQLSREEAEKELTEQETIDAERARENADQTRDDAVRIKADTRRAREPRFPPRIVSNFAALFPVYSLFIRRIEMPVYYTPVHRPSNYDLSYLRRP